MHAGIGSEFGHYSKWLCGPGTIFPGPFGWLVTLFFWGLVIYLVIKLIRAILLGARGDSGTHLDILKERYTRGEINREEYRRMKTELG